MAGLHRYKCFLIQINSSIESESQQTENIVLSDKPIVIGRDASCCDIVLDSTKYQEVSRQHLKISPLSSGSPSDLPQWEISDLESRNGIYINGQRLQGSQILQVHDQIKLGRKGPEFVFECEQISFVGISDIFPVVSGRVDLHQKGFLVPGIVTVIFVVAMLATRDNNNFNFLYILAAYLAFASHYVIHKLCHKHKPWWLLVSLGLATGLPLLTAHHELATIFHDILPGDASEHNESILAIILKEFFKAGLLEELFKVLPVILVYFIGRLLQSPKRELIGVWEPMDGILLATASATGFALVESLMLVHEETQSKGNFAGLTLLIPLILGDICGQVAYSGYFGYFIGLGAMKPKKLWRFIGIGYLTSASLHTIGAIISELQKEHKLDFLIGNVLSALIGSVAYIFLMAAIVKANQLSPAHSHKSVNR
ncbi:MAG: PrsW family intramembrane metalloprotease [Brasilonema octagenarum HA4186-MV1]|jgi:RsiW-degrading membrane proteinase PrsW (M82 family)|uniref:PrsW family intramembrane metalloprotease n=2 Tax=Brasilonema TaxID=383614 RepID=A0A856MK97_9CYAN|nr:MULTISPECIES: PrsW family glutamic-type intramembrane protease [Brasilonema]MBW4630258.1 PrsW family intramembrane metalloprotease [Brasilonema octagenarum HA4186-MV1]NMF67125.1 PrsW family intramembrane metalloprotease [Brasilonema octagenarum UFV-OR1]QDL09366.1 PrsW family intramembrane metalloprotease [Brasilonema sennae CENA114]QDL15722.1 PrsW family intramembrane metalloprotease [Brasilonema octagenarum UFV-E1]